MIASLNKRFVMRAGFALLIAAGACGGDSGGDETVGGSGGGGGGGSAGSAGKPAGSGGSNTAGSTAGSSGGSIAGAAAGASAGASGGSAAGAAGGAVAGATAGMSGGAGMGAAGMGMAGMGAAGMGAAGMGMPSTKACPAAGTPCKVMVAGDGLVLGLPGTAGGILKTLNTRLGAKGTLVGTVTTATFKNEGRANATIGSVSGMLAGQISAQKPHIILIWAGSEDIWNGTAPAMVATAILGAVDAAVTAAPEARVIAVMPPGLDHAWDQQQMKQWNFKVWQATQAVGDGIVTRAAAGKRVSFVDTERFMAGISFNNLPKMPVAADFNNGSNLGGTIAYTTYNKYLLRDPGYDLIATIVVGYVTRELN